MDEMHSVHTLNDGTSIQRKQNLTPHNRRYGNVGKEVVDIEIRDIKTNKKVFARRHSVAIGAMSAKHNMGIYSATQLPNIVGRPGMLQNTKHSVLEYDQQQTDTEEHVETQAISFREKIIKKNRGRRMSLPGSGMELKMSIPVQDIVTHKPDIISKGENNDDCNELKNITKPVANAVIFVQDDSKLADNHGICTDSDLREADCENMYNTEQVGCMQSISGTPPRRVTKVHDKLQVKHVSFGQEELIQPRIEPKQQPINVRHVSIDNGTLINESRESVDTTMLRSGRRASVDTTMLRGGGRWRCLSVDTIMNRCGRPTSVDTPTFRSGRRASVDTTMLRGGRRACVDIATLKLMVDSHRGAAKLRYITKLATEMARGVLDEEPAEPEPDIYKEIKGCRYLRMTPRQGSADSTDSSN